MSINKERITVFLILAAAALAWFGPARVARAIGVRVVTADPRAGVKP